MPNDKKISQLDETLTLADVDLITTVQSSSNKKMTGASLKSVIGFQRIGNTVSLKNAGDHLNLGVSKLTAGYIQTDITFAGVSNVEGLISWNTDAGTLQVGMPGGDVVGQMFQELYLASRPKNVQGVQIDNGEVVYISGATGAITEVKLSNAGILESLKTIALATEDVSNNQRGFFTTHGLVNDINTIAFSEGDQVYLDTTDGQIVNTKPIFPNYTVELGIVARSHASEGSIDVHINTTRGEDLSNFFNGTFRENFNALAASADGINVVMSLEKSGTGDLTMQFCDGLTVLDCTPALTIALTPGTDASPQPNYIYIPQSTKVLTKSTSNWPSGEHIRIGYFFVSSAATVQSDGGVLINQNWNNPLADVLSLEGGYNRLMERIRAEGAIYFSGLDGQGGDDYTTSSAGVVTVQIGAGIGYQAGEHSIPAVDTSGADDVHVVNASAADGGAYTELSNLYLLTEDANGGTLTNKFFNVVLISILNKTGEYSPALLNMPTGSYNTLSGAEADTSGFDVTTIPREFEIDSSTALLVCRLTFRKLGGTWAYQSTTDLRRRGVVAGAGGPSGALVNFSDALLTIFNNTDPLKIMDFDISSVTTGNTRTLTMADRDLNLSTPTFDATTLTDNLFGNGTFGAGTASPISGAGTFLLWNPKLAAFRTGRVRGTEWDVANIGNYSFAGGLDSQANGQADFAYGEDCIANGGPAVAMGSFCEAKAFGAVALGEQHDITTAGFYSAAVGSSHTMSEQYGFAANNKHTITGRYASAFGNECTAQSFNALYAGRFNTISGTTDSWVATEPLFLLGNGTNAGARSDAFTILKNGNVIMGGDTISSDGALNITPGAGTALNINLSTTGDFTINTTDFVLDTATGDVALGKVASSNLGLLDILTADDDYGFVHENASGIKFTTYSTSDGAWVGTQSNHPLYFFTGDSSPHAFVDMSGNFGVGTDEDAALVATGAADVLALANGVLGSALDNHLQITSKDLSSGNTMLAFQTEGVGASVTGIGAIAGNSYVAQEWNGTTLYLHASTTVPVDSVNLQTGTIYTVTASDMSQLVKCTNASAITVTLPEVSTEDLVTGFECFIEQGGAGQVTIVVEGSDVLHSADSLSKLRTQYSGVWVKKEADGTYYISGDLTA